MTQDMCEDLKIKRDSLMRLYYGNESRINIAHSSVPHDKIKHIEIDQHFNKKKLERGLI